MDTEGTYDARGTRSGSVPRPAGPPPRPALPPRPVEAPAAGPALGDWLRTPRAPAEPGLWRYGHTAAPRTPTRTGCPDRALLGGALVALLAATPGLVAVDATATSRTAGCCSNCSRPTGWWSCPRPPAALDRHRGLQQPVRGPADLRLRPARQLARGVPAVRRRLPAARADPAHRAGRRRRWSGWSSGPACSRSSSPSGCLFPLSWTTGSGDRGGGDVRQLRAVRAWSAARPLALRQAGRLAAATSAAAGQPAATPPPQARAPPRPRPAPRRLAPAARRGPGRRRRPAGGRGAGRADERRRLRPHPAGLGDRCRPTPPGSARSPKPSPGRARGPACTPRATATCPPARPPTTCSPRRSGIGRSPTPSAPRTPAGARAPRSTRPLLGSSLLAVGPFGSGKTRHLVRPVVESLALQALAGKAAVVAVCAAGTPLGADDGYDVVIKPGDPASAYDLDLYGGATDPDEAAALLAEALAGDLARGRLAAGRRPPSPSCSAPTARPTAASPPCPCCASCSTASPGAIADAAGAPRRRGSTAPTMRELDARARQLGTPGRSRTRRSPPASRCSTAPPSRGSSTPPGETPAVLAALPRTPAAGPRRPARTRPPRGRRAC